MSKLSPESYFSVSADNSPGAHGTSVMELSMQTCVNSELSELHALFESPSAAWHVLTGQAGAEPPARSHLGSDAACVLLTCQPGVWSCSEMNARAESTSGHVLTGGAMAVQVARGHLPGHGVPHLRRVGHFYY